MQPGELIATGRTSDVFEYGSSQVIKVPRPDVPEHWVAIEAELTSIVHERGLPAPAVEDIVTINDRRCVVFERVHGVPMWEHMVADPTAVDRLVDELVAVQRTIHSAGIPPGIPDLIARTARKIEACEPSNADERREAIRLLEAAPRGAALLHGDLHPGNILMTTSGLVVIDWFDAAIGHPIADVARSLLLMAPRFETIDLFHLPGATPALVGRIHARFLDNWSETIEMLEDALALWEPILALARISEGAHADPAPLLAVWAGRARSPVDPPSRV